MLDTYMPIEEDRLQSNNGITMGSSTYTGYNYRQ